MLKYQNYLLPRCIPGCGIGRSASQRSYLAWPVVSALCAARKKFAPSVPVVIKDVCFVFSGSIDQVEKKKRGERTNERFIAQQQGKTTSHNEQLGSVCGGTWPPKLGRKIGPSMEPRTRRSSTVRGWTKVWRQLLVSGGSSPLCGPLFRYGRYPRTHKSLHHTCPTKASIWVPRKQQPPIRSRARDDLFLFLFRVVAGAPDCNVPQRQGERIRRKRIIISERGEATADRRVRRSKWIPPKSGKWGPWDFHRIVLSLPRPPRLSTVVWGVFLEKLLRAAPTKAPQEEAAVW